MILIQFKCYISTLAWDNLNEIHYINFPIIGHRTMHKVRGNIWGNVWSGVIVGVMEEMVSVGCIG